MGTDSHQAISVGKWLRQTRISRGLTLQDIVDQSELEAATLSRNEAERSAPTMLTVVRACLALKTPPRELLNAVYPAAIIDTEADLGATAPQPETLLTFTDVVRFVTALRHNPASGLRHLLDVARKMADLEAQAHKQPISPISVSEMMRVLMPWVDPIMRNTVSVAPISSADVLAIFQASGILTIADVDRFVIAMLQTLPQPQHKNKKLEKTLERLKQVTIQRVLCQDILAFDAAVGAGGRVVLSYWWACQMFDTVTNQRWPEDWYPADHALATLLISFTRWLHCYGHRDLTLVRQSFSEGTSSQTPLFGKR